MLQALAAKGVGSQYARDITLTRAGTQFSMSTRPKFNEIILQDGDVITALQGQAIFNP